jgi:transcriptional regulator with XRE-family HTH domain
MSSGDDSAAGARIALVIREELARQRLSRAALAAKARISLSSLEKALAGHRAFTMQSLVRLEEALGVPLRRAPESAIAPDRLGSYARPAVAWITGSYFTIRPSLSDAAAVYAYRTDIVWDEAKSHLVFTEHDRVDTPFAQFGDVSIPHQSGYIYLVTNRQGQYRLAILARPAIGGEMYGLLATLQAVRGAHLMPLAAPLALIPMNLVPSTGVFGKISPGDANFERWRGHLARAGEYCQLLAPAIP